MATSIKAAATNWVDAVRKDLEAKIAEGERAKTALAALDLVFGNGAPKHYGNGEPDAELAAAAGLRIMGNWTRTDKWRKYLKMRRDGVASSLACNRLNLHPRTAAKLEALV